MDNTINQTIIDKVVSKKVAIFKAISMLPPPEIKDLWADTNSIEHQKNCENKNVSEINDTMNDTKTNVMQNDWRNITDPKLRRKMRLKEWRSKNKNKTRSYYHKNKEQHRKSQKEYYNRTRDYHIERTRKYRSLLDKDKKRLRSKQYHLKNKNNPLYKLKRSLRGRLIKALNGNFKTGSAVNDLGCSIEQLKLYLESKFQPGMTWDNHGYYGWHIDHIRPLASFDLTDRKQMLEACHYTNLQPLWSTDNLTKGDR